MFTSKGLFANVFCPHQENCILPRCIFKHPDGKLVDSGPAVISAHTIAARNEQDGQRKRQKVSDEKDDGTIASKAISSQEIVQGEDSTKRPVAARGDRRSKSLSAATREISPPPLKKATQNASSSTKPATKPTTGLKAMPKTPVKAAIKQEGLNPRGLKYPAPATHDMRYRLLRALYEHFERLNTELRKDAKEDEESLVLSDQELITRALDIEEEATLSASIYSNLVKNKILQYKRMTVPQWIAERTKEVTAEKAKAAALSTPVPLPSAQPKVIGTGLTPEEELTILPRLYTPITHLTKHGYVNSIPTPEEIETAKKGIEAAKGWEVCDRCKSRFQVFPERREEDGALASGGTCRYHYGKPFFPERLATDPKGTKREKRYRCCGEGIGESTGCTTAPSHVFKISEVKRLAAILNFACTPENPDLVKKGKDKRPVCIDGEMGYTVYGLELIRLTATSWPSGDALFDVLVRPVGLILDLNSRFSGVYPHHMADAKPYTPSSSLPSITLSSKKQALHIVDSPAAARDLLFQCLTPLTPLVGHGLENDLNATRLIHPTIIDTALLFPHKAGLPYRNGLKALMQVHLNRHIQVVKAGIVDGDGKEELEGHDSKEDANAAGDLVRFALGEEWGKMQRDGWKKADGAFVPPPATTGGVQWVQGRRDSNESLQKGFLGHFGLETEELKPSKIAGRKRTRDEAGFELGVVELKAEEKELKAKGGKRNKDEIELDLDEDIQTPVKFEKGKLYEP